MTRRLCSLLAAVTAFVAPGAAQADWERGLYAGFSYGKSRIWFEPVAPASSITEDENDYGYSAYLGYRLHRYVALEGGYTDFGTFSSEWTFPGGSHAITMSLTGIHFSGRAILPLGSFDLFAKVGVVITRSTTDHVARNNAQTIRSHTREIEGWPKVGFGVELRTSGSVALRLEYEHVSRTGDETATQEGMGNVGMLTIGVRFQ